MDPIIDSLPVPEYAVALMETWTKEERYRFFDSSSHYQGLVCVSVFVASICAWEHFLLFPAEIRTWKLLLVGRFQFARVAVLIGRYSLLALIGCICSITMGRPRSCGIMMSAVIALYLVTWSCCATVYLARLNIIWSGNRTVIGCCTVIMLLCLAVWVAVAFTAYSFSELPKKYQFPHGLKCYITIKAKIAASGWLLACLFDVVVLLLTLHRLKQMKAKGGLAVRTHRWLWHSSVTHFSFSLGVHVACFISQLVISDWVLIHLPNTIGFGCQTIIASRLALSSRGWVTEFDAEESFEDDLLDIAVHEAVRRGESGGRGSKRRTQVPNITFQHSVQEQYEYSSSPPEANLCDGLNGAKETISRKTSTSSATPLRRCSSGRSDRPPSTLIRGTEHEQRMASLDESSMPRRSSLTDRHSRHFDSGGSDCFNARSHVSSHLRRATIHGLQPTMSKAMPVKGGPRPASFSQASAGPRRSEGSSGNGMRAKNAMDITTAGIRKDSGQAQAMQDGEHSAASVRKVFLASKHRHRAALALEMHSFGQASETEWRGDSGGSGGDSPTVKDCM